MEQPLEVVVGAARVVLATWHGVGVVALERHLGPSCDTPRRRRVDLEPHPLDPGVVEGVEGDVLRPPQPRAISGPTLAPWVAQRGIGVVGEVHARLADAEPGARVTVTG